MCIMDMTCSFNEQVHAEERDPPSYLVSGKAGELQEPENPRRKQRERL